jgi:hypothetical protein
MSDMEVTVVYHLYMPHRRGRVAVSISASDVQHQKLVRSMSSNAPPIPMFGRKQATSHGNKQKLDTPATLGNLETAPDSKIYHCYLMLLYPMLPILPVATVESLVLLSPLNMNDQASIRMTLSPHS